MCRRRTAELTTASSWGSESRNMGDRSVSDPDCCWKSVTVLSPACGMVTLHSEWIEIRKLLYTRLKPTVTAIRLIYPQNEWWWEKAGIRKWFVDSLTARVPLSSWRLGSRLRETLVAIFMRFIASLKIHFFRKGSDSHLLSCCCPRRGIITIIVETILKTHSLFRTCCISLSPVSDRARSVHIQILATVTPSIATSIASERKSVSPFLPCSAFRVISMLWFLSSDVTRTASQSTVKMKESNYLNFKGTLISRMKPQTWLSHPPQCHRAEENSVFCIPVRRRVWVIESFLSSIMKDGRRKTDRLPQIQERTGFEFQKHPNLTTETANKTVAAFRLSTTVIAQLVAETQFLASVFHSCGWVIPAEHQRVNGGIDWRRKNWTRISKAL